MKQSRLRLMKGLKLAITLLFGIVIGLGSFVLTAFAVNRGMTVHGMEIFLGVLKALRT